MARRSILLLVCLLLCMALAAPAAANADWAVPALDYAMETGMLPADDLRGGDNATRAEMAQMVTQLLDLTAEAPLSAFTDLANGHPQQQALSRAVALGLLNGIDGALCPDDPVTRQQAFVILSRAFALPEGDIVSLNRFADWAQVGDWAAPAAAGLTELGLVRGSDGLLRPQDPVSRQELAQLLLNLTQRVCDGSGGTAIIPAGSTVPAGTVIDGDLYLCCNGGSAVALENVTVSGRIVVRGSGSIALTNVTAAELLLCDSGVSVDTGGSPLAITVCAPRAVITGGAASVSSSGTLTLKKGTYHQLHCSGGSVTVETGAVVTDAQLKEKNIVLTGAGRAQQVTVTQPGCTVSLPATKLIEHIDYGLQNVSAVLQADSDIYPTAPTLTASLTLTDATPLLDEKEKSLWLRWRLGNTIIREEFISLGQEAVIPLVYEVDYAASLPEGKLTAELSRAEETLTVSQSVNLHEELAPPLVETIEVEATVHTATGLFADMMLTQYIDWVNEGTTGIYVNYCTDHSAQLVLSDGRMGWVNITAVTISQENYLRGLDYTDSEKERYVNFSGYTSETPYLVWISLKCQRVNVFIGSTGNWKLAQSFTVATGKNSTPTIAGVFSYQFRVDRWDFGDYYVQPVLIFNGGHAFHSRTYTPSGNLLDPTLGYPVSAGCIRMRDEDVLWLDQYLPLHSTVVVY